MRLILLRGPVCLFALSFPAVLVPFLLEAGSPEGFKPLRRPVRNPTKLTNAKLVRGFGNTRSRSHCGPLVVAHRGRCRRSVL